MEFAQLRTFLAVLERGSFSAAATQLRVGQSTVSFHIKALETATGSQLLDRRGGRVQPTEAGRVLLRYAPRIVSLRNEALAALREEESAETGRVVIAASTIPGEYLLPPILAAFRRKHGRVALCVDVLDSARATAALLAQECDFAVVGARPRDRRVTSAPVGDDEVFLVGPSPNPFARNGRLTHAELAEIPLIVREAGSGTYGAVARLLEGHDVSATVQVGSTEGAKRCVREGLGLAYLSRRAVAEDLTAGRMKVVSFPGTPVRRTFHAARLRSVTLSAPARALHALLLQHHR